MNNIGYNFFFKNLLVIITCWPQKINPWYDRGTLAIQAIYELSQGQKEEKYVEISDDKWKQRKNTATVTLS